jgi:hypothetical protein
MTFQRDNTPVGTDALFDTFSSSPFCVEPSFAERITCILRYGDTISNEPVIQAATALENELVNNPELYHEQARAQVVAGLMKLAFGTHEESAALSHARSVSGLDPVMGAVTYAFSAIHGPKENLFLVKEGLKLIDPKLAAWVLEELVGTDASWRIVMQSLDYLAADAPSKAVVLANAVLLRPELPDVLDTLCKDISQLSDPKDPALTSALSEEERGTVLRIIPAIQQLISGSKTELRQKAVELLADEPLKYALPTLALAAQMHDDQVRALALLKIATLDSEVAEHLARTSPTFCSRTAPAIEDADYIR